MRYKEYPKKKLLKASQMCGDAPNFWDISKWPQWWESGAKELDKSTPGKIITAPIELPATVLTATKKTVEQVPSTVKTISSSIPLIAIAATVIGVGYLVYKFKSNRPKETEE